MTTVPAIPCLRVVRWYVAAPTDKKDQAKLVCTWERMTGSNLPEKVCRMPEQRATQPPPSSGQTGTGG